MLILSIFSFILILLSHQCFSANVTCNRSGLLTTTLQQFKVQGITFNKRVQNGTSTTSLEFVISDLTSSSHEIRFLLNDEELDIDKLDSSDSQTRSNCYYTEAKNPNNQVTVTVTLKDKKIMPGNYTLILSAEQTAAGSCFVRSAPILPSFTKPKRVLQGDPLRVACKVSGYPLPSSVEWSFAYVEPSRSDDETVLKEAIYRLAPLVVNSSRFILMNSDSPDSVVNDTVRFYKLDNEDNGIYACNVTSEEGSDFTILIINVKDRWAALWPFIGIVIEVTVLVTAILLYERHQLRSAKQQQQASVPRTGTNTGMENGNTVVCSPTFDNDTNAVPNDEKLRQRSTVKT